MAPRHLLFASPKMLAEPLLDGAPPKAPRCVVWQVVFFVNVFAACISLRDDALKLRSSLLVLPYA